MFGNGAIDLIVNTNSGSIGGLTYGIGVQRVTSSGGIFRIELIRDDLDSIISGHFGSAKPTWETTTLSVSYLIGF